MDGAMVWLWSYTNNRIKFITDSVITNSSVFMFDRNDFVNFEYKIKDKKCNNYSDISTTTQIQGD